MEKTRRTAVIVDDEPVTRMDLADMLEEAGFRVAGEAGDGFDAVELCEEKRPDVVLMDVKMPVFDGLTAAETILSRELAGCVVLLTAFQDREIVERAGRIGVTGYLAKPIDPRCLLPTLELALAQSERLQGSREQTRLVRQQMEDDRLVHRAQRAMARRMGCTEEEAYHKMRRMAMDKRVTVASLARRLLEQMEGRKG
ncbi:MAG: response regulator [Oscillospiraceae bacterium]|jgi:AmiR/NasT family two-component response regulator|nr:response regulator [Oscillospiraceae bacterium]